MLTIEKFSIFIPEKKLSIIEMESETGLSKSMLSIFKSIYGLQSIPVWQGDTQSLLKYPLEHLCLSNPIADRIEYIIYVHTASWISLIDDRVDCFLQRYFPSSQVSIFESTLYKCVGFFKAIELLSQIMAQDSLALILTGESAFTPKLRVVPRSTIAGDAATATLLSRTGSAHHLLSVYTKLIPHYEKGIYLSDTELKAFESSYIAETQAVIKQVLSNAGITLSQITLILPHNVNRPTWLKIADALSFPIEKIYLKNIPLLGHCFCSDHIINLNDAILEEWLQQGDYYLMVGCGLGFFISAAVWQF